MKRGKQILPVLLIALLTGLSCSGTTDTASVTVSGYRVVASYPHDRFAFTEGLSFADGYLFEGTGIPGHSSIRKVSLETGEILDIRELPDSLFGEGITFFEDMIAQVTESANLGFIYSSNDLAPLGDFSYSTEGWGITWDGEYLIMSDGSEKLYFLDPVDFTRIRQIQVNINGEPLTMLNELEFVQGMIYSNIWPTDSIAVISPEDGTVTTLIDLKGLLPPQYADSIGWSDLAGFQPSIPLQREDCLNGIAYDEDNDRLFVTGKLWPLLFEIEVVPR